jgi:hypothetical protein
MNEGDFISGSKRQEREADQSSPYRAEFKNGGAMPALSYIFLWHSA